MCSDIARRIGPMPVPRVSTRAAVLALTGLIAAFSATGAPAAGEPADTYRLDTADTHLRDVAGSHRRDVADTPRRDVANTRRRDLADTRRPEAADVVRWRAVSDRDGQRVDVGAVPASRVGNVAKGFLRMQYAAPQRTFDRQIEYDRMDGALELDCVEAAFRPLTGRAYLRGVLVQEVVGEPARTASPAPRGGQAMELISEACAN